MPKSYWAARLSEARIARVRRIWPPPDPAAPRAEQNALPLGVFERYAGLLPRALRKPVRMLRNGLVDLRYGALLRGLKKTPFGALGAFDTVNTDYSTMPFLFANHIKETDVLVDVGCGKGRVINWWLSRGHRNPMVGLELDEKLVDAMRRRFRRYPNVRIIQGDALENLPADGTLFYLLNPFDKASMERFKLRFLELFGSRDPLIILYGTESGEVFRNERRLIYEEFDFEPLSKSGLDWYPFALIRINHNR